MQFSPPPRRATPALLAVFALLAACGGDDEATAAALAPDCTALRQLVLPNTVMLQALRVEAGAASAEGVALPAHCLLQGEIEPRTGVNGVRYSVGFELRLPLQWNGRFHFQGGGGVDGVLRPAYGTLRAGVTPALAQGAAVVSSDMGHTGTSSRDASFGADPQARLDWGYQAMDKVTLLSKTVIERFYGQGPRWSYYIGSSGGGRQGMMMAQRFPAHFDGIVSGAPILEQHLAQVSSMQMLQAFTAIAPRNASGQPILSRSFSDDDLKLIAAGVLRRCDALDGAADGLIEAYPACQYDVAELQCTGAKDASCLSAEQVDAFTRVMAGPRNSAGTLLYPGAPWDTGIGEPEWRSDQIGSATGPVPNSRKYTNESIRMVFMTPPAPGFDYLKFDFDKDPASMLASASFSATNSTDYAGFKARQGKQIVYMGLSDYLVNPSGVNRWYRALVQAQGGVEATRNFVRLFNVPGMAHSDGGRSLDIFDPVTAIHDWVEKGIAPDHLRATGTRFPGRERPICAWPQIARYSGSGSVDAFSSFVCSNP